MSRLKRRERRQSHVSLPLALILFGAFSIFIALTAILLATLFYSTRLDSLERRASVQLEGAIGELRATLEREAAPARSVLATARDVLVSDPSLVQDTAALRSRFVPLLRHQPNIVTLSVRVGDERSWDITRDGDTWLTRRTVEGDHMRATVWERWNTPGVERLSEQADAPLPPVQEDPDCQAALEVAHGRSDGNRFGEPKALWSAPGRNALNAHPVMLLLAAFERDNLPPVWVGVTADFSSLGALVRHEEDEATDLSVVATRSGVLLAVTPALLGTLTSEGDNVAPLPTRDQIAAHPVGAALHRWLTDTYPPDGVFAQRTGDTGWWFEARAHPLSPQQDLVVLAGVAESDLLAVEIILRNRLVAGGLAALLIAAIASWLIARSVNRPLREFVKRTRRIDVLDRALGTRTRSRIREVDVLHEALDDLSGEVAERVHSREMPLIITAEPVRRLSGASTDALTISSGDGTAPELVSDGLEGVDTDMPYVPEAYVQAIQTTRRKLRQVSQELEAQRHAVASMESHKEEEVRRWAHVRDAAAALSTDLGEHGHDFDLLAAEAVKRLCHVLDASRASVWLVEEAFHRLVLVHRADRIEPGIHAQVVLERESHPLFFAALDAAPCLSVRDTSTDPRTVSYVAAVPWTPPPCALLAAPVRLHHGIVAVLVVEHAIASGAWPASSESLVCMTAAGMAASWELSKRPDATGPLASTTTVEEEDDEYTESPLFRQLIEGTRGAVIAVNREGRITFANTAADQLYGQPGQAWPGKLFTDLSASGYAASDESALLRILGGEERVDMDTEHVTASGNSIALRLTWAPLEDEEGEVTGAVVLAVDVRDIKDHQGELKRSEARFRGYVEGLAGVFFSLDTMGCVNYVSPAAQQIYGYTPGEMTGQPIAMLADASHADKDLDAFHALLQGGACSGYETVHRARTGEPIPLAVFASVRVGAEGELAGITGVAFPRPSGYQQE